MNISELKNDYPLIYKAALANQEAQGNFRDDSRWIGADKAGRNFTWDQTPEGKRFWYCIEHEYFKEAEKIHPYLFNKHNAYELWS